MKNYQHFYKLFLTTLIIFILFSRIGFSQQVGVSEYQYISPFPGSSMNSPSTDIIIRYGPAYKASDVLNSSFLEVSGNKSGLHSGQIILTENDRTILFKPDIPFSESEKITVKFLRTINTEENKAVPMLKFSFRITEHNMTNFYKNNRKKILFKEYTDSFRDIDSNPIRINKNNVYYSIMDDSLPDSFPNIKMDSINNPTPGLIFLSPFSAWNLSYKNYLIIVDNYGVPVFYRKITSLLFDFKKIDTNELVYHDALTAQYYILDSSYNVIDSIYALEGYVADLHDLAMDEAKSTYLLSYDWQKVKMDTVISGGNPNATVIGLVVQEQDKNRNVIFQWRSWDHFKITDATYDINLKDSVIDYVHGNAIEIDNDGNILISSRHLDEVTKIDRQTGNIIWRLGGKQSKNNQFTFINDSTGFSHQHDIRRLENGNITVFDNGNLHFPPRSRVAEYQLDEKNKLAFLVWEYKNDPVSFSAAMGNARRFPNHNTFIGWGTGQSPAISEVTPSGEIVQYLSLPDTVYNYRGFKFSWKTNLFVGKPESLVFGYVPVGDSMELPLEIINNSDKQIEINGIYHRDSVYITEASLPISLAPFGKDSIVVKFKPVSEGNYFDDLHLRWDTDGQRIAQVIPLIGSTDPNFTSINETVNNPKNYYLAQNYPNPFNPITTISYQIPIAGFVSLKVYDILGKEIATLVGKEQTLGNYDVAFNAAYLPSGIYFYRLQTGSFVETKKMILLK